MKKDTLGLFILILFVLQACGGNPQQAGFNGQRGPQATSVETINISQQSISRQIRSFGTVEAKDVVQVTPQVSNRVTQIYAHLGDTVSQGEPLAKIYDATLQEQAQQARAQVAQSMVAFERDSAQFARQLQLYERDLISKAELQSARATFQSSKAQLQSARATLTQHMENLDNTVIRSPVYGVVLTRNIVEGDLASSGQVAYEIGNLTGFETHVYLPLQEWERVDVGQPVNFRLSNEQPSPATGRVARISPRLDPTTGLGEVVIAFTQKGPSIYQGVLLESIINVETHANTVVIPRSALVENVQTLIEPESNTIQIERSYSAFVVQGDTLALKRDLTLGIEQGDRVEVLSGLQSGDEIVITGQSNLEDSTRVRVVTGNAFDNRSVPLGGEDAPAPQRSQDTSSTSES